MRFLLVAHGRGASTGRIEEPGLLHDAIAMRHDVDLPFYLVLERLLQKPERVQILHLRFRPERRRAGGPHRYVRVAAEAALFHVAVVDAEPYENRPKTGEEPGGIGRRAQIRLGDDLDERHAAAVVVDVRLAPRVRKSLVQGLAGIFLHVHARDADTGGPARGGRVFDHAAGRQRLLVLGDLITLGEIRVEVVLPREHRRLVDPAPERERRLDRLVHGRAVQNGQRARQAEADWADVRVRRRAELGAAAAEDLRSRLELRVNLEPDDWFVLVCHGLLFV